MISTNRSFAIPSVRKLFRITNVGRSSSQGRRNPRDPNGSNMVASNYAARRSAFAKEIGLGRTRSVASKRRKRG